MDNKIIIKKYINNINKVYLTGAATEHSYRGCFQNFLELLNPEITLINDPKRQECGAPDFLVQRNRKNNIGYIETKDLGASLKKVQSTKQIRQYLDSLNNFILTDYLNFIWFVRGEPREEVSIGVFNYNKEVYPDVEQFDKFSELMQAFSKTLTEPINSSLQLAKRMASIAKLIKNAIIKSFQDQDYNGDLTYQLNAFRKHLLNDLDQSTFADMYAQTICYGYFASKYHHKQNEHFDRQTAKLPRTNPFLRWLFTHIAGSSLDERISWIIDDLTELLNNCNLHLLMENSEKSKWKKDPVLHFYENFLQEYNSEIRAQRGVYYTPDPVVKYIVKGVDELLIKKFKIKHGLADDSKIVLKKATKREPEVVSHKVNILDPACGTGTFLNEVINTIHQSFGKNEGAWKGYVTDSLISRLFGFEILMAPYAIAHLKVWLKFCEQKAEPAKNKRINIILTNALERPYEYANLPLFEQAVSDEVNTASNVKLNTPVMVVLGNPPYSASSQNQSEWLKGLLHGRDLLNHTEEESYFHIDGKPLDEKNPRWLNDDYVKFIRFGQWRIDKTGSGILAFITNNAYLSNPTFRGMRKSLLNSFNDIYILNLNGNSNISDKTNEGSLDKNVFDIKQGVCIAFFVKKANSKQKTNVHYCDLKGSREDYELWINDIKLSNTGKYNWLIENNLESTPWTKLIPVKPFYWFVPREESLRPEYDKFWGIDKIFNEKSVGMVSARDRLTIHFTNNELLKTVELFSNLGIEEARKFYSLGKDSQDWKIEFAQNDIRRLKKVEKNCIQISYRPFDARYTVFTGNSKGFFCRPRENVSKQFLEGSNLGLVYTRQVKGEKYNHVFVSDKPVDFTFLSSKSSNATYIAPLFLIAEGKKVCNIAKEFIESLLGSLSLKFTEKECGNMHSTVGPKDVLAYIYAVLWNPSFTKRYHDLLISEFPKIPIVNDTSLFFDLVNIGHNLLNIHIEEPDSKIINFPKAGSNIIQRVSFEDNKEDNGRILINENQYFSNISYEVWDFKIGGYTVCKKWLEDRKNRQMSYSDIQDYKNLLVKVSLTLKEIKIIQSKIGDRIWKNMI